MQRPVSLHLCRLRVCLKCTRHTCRGRSRSSRSLCNHTTEDKAKLEKVRQLCAAAARSLRDRKLKACVKQPSGRSKMPCEPPSAISMLFSLSLSRHSAGEKGRVQSAKFPRAGDYPQATSRRLPKYRKARPRKCPAEAWSLERANTQRTLNFAACMEWRCEWSSLHNFSLNFIMVQMYLVSEIIKLFAISPQEHVEDVVDDKSRTIQAWP